MTVCLGWVFAGMDEEVWGLVLAAVGSDVLKIASNHTKMQFESTTYFKGFKNFHHTSFIVVVLEENI